MGAPSPWGKVRFAINRTSLGREKSRVIKREIVSFIAPKTMEDTHDHSSTAVTEFWCKTFNFQKTYMNKSCKLSYQSNEFSRTYQFSNLVHTEPTRALCIRYFTKKNDHFVYITCSRNKMHIISYNKKHIVLLPSRTLDVQEVSQRCVRLLRHKQQVH